MRFLANKSVLITGGTGSFGSNLLKYLTNLKEKPKRIIIFSRDELKQFELSKVYDEKKYPNIRYFLGDVRDKQRLNFALVDVDFVIHAAALKHVPIAEYNPIEFIKTNIIGSQNIIEASIESGVKKVVSLSTDKASSPINLYGATKLCADKLFISANNIAGKKNTKFSVVRYGNVMGSRGSVIPKFINDSKKKILHITDKDMTRFNITIEEGVSTVIWALKNAYGSEIIVPKLPSYSIIDLAKSICQDCKLNFTGVRPGEKRHEEMISIEESRHTIDLKDKYVIYQQDNQNQFNYYKKNFNGKLIKNLFSYNSRDNKFFLKENELKNLIKSIKMAY
jgi:UDP-N-acetylglucosamine 4,6-dehydratase/5-epimerase